MFKYTKNSNINSEPDLSDPRLMEHCEKCGHKMFKVYGTLDRGQEKHRASCQKCYKSFMLKSVGASYRLTWGKHKGKEIADIPEDYLIWIVDAGKGPDRMIETFRKEAERRELNCFFTAPEEGKEGDHVFEYGPNKGSRVKNLPTKKLDAIVRNKFVADRIKGIVAKYLLSHMK